MWGIIVSFFWGLKGHHKPTAATGSQTAAKVGSSIQKQCSHVGGLLGPRILCQVFFQAVQQQKGWRRPGGLVGRGQQLEKLWN